jgi:hypothetical protein
MRTAIAFLILTLSASACGGDVADPPEAGKTKSADPSGPETELTVQVASYDIAVGRDRRVLVGLLTEDQRFVSFGEVEMEFFFLGEKSEGEGVASPGPTATGRFFLVPGESADTSRSGPVAVPPSEGRGVYEAHVDFDRPGAWAVQVYGDVEGAGQVVGNSVFEVLADTQVPAEGEVVEPLENFTLESDVSAEAIDSRAGTDGPIPDPRLHRTTIADALERERPVLAVFSTPVFCVSQFCGPITDMIDNLSRKYPDLAEYVHVEIWRDFENEVLNPAAEEWLSHDGGLQEPWVFLIDREGTIIERWDNVAPDQEVEKALLTLTKR